MTIHLSHFGFNGEITCDKAKQMRNMKKKVAMCQKVFIENTKNLIKTEKERPIGRVWCLGTSHPYIM